VSRILIEKETLCDLYITKRMSQTKVAKFLGVAILTVSKYLKRYSIKIRTTAEQHRINLAGKRLGHWIVMDETKYNDCGRGVKWKCLCTRCQTEDWVISSRLRSGESLQCSKCSNSDNRIGRGDLSGTYWGKLVYRARRKNITLNVSLKYAWSIFKKQKGLCALSNVPIELGYKKKHSASLDRIDSNKGYVKNNIQWVHKDVNRMKSNFDQLYFILMCKNIIRCTNEKSTKLNSNK
jgi:hypothetical protein